ncbi:hypothetical protein FA95DRAFT_1611971 [Auriscalpium vulgare]|uniref:Uncharacterized protein n=1 Tax=Auriscalpium vulgare TaxID=40419 RepID=A0ACB8R823_9AGAM|nr:hypothetical protein FA95DRAFT_1611971 [Auriscalpium vulgare]
MNSLNPFDRIIPIIDHSPDPSTVAELADGRLLNADLDVLQQIQFAAEQRFKLASSKPVGSSPLPTVQGEVETRTIRPVDDTGAGLCPVTTVQASGQPVAQPLSIPKAFRSTSLPDPPSCSTPAVDTSSCMYPSSTI